MLDIPNVESKLFFPTQRVAAVNLRPACDAWLHLVAARLLGCVPFEVLHEERPRPHEAELAPEDVPKLRQLVEAGRAKEAADEGQSLLVREMMTARPDDLPHCPEFDQPERAPAAAGALLPEENRTAHPRPHQGCQEGQERPEAKEPQSRRGPVDHFLNDPSPAGLRSTAEGHAPLPSELLHRLEIPPRERVAGGVFQDPLPAPPAHLGASRRVARQLPDRLGDGLPVLRLRENACPSLLADELPRDPVDGQQRRPLADHVVEHFIRIHRAEGGVVLQHRRTGVTRAHEVWHALLGLRATKGDVVELPAAGFCLKRRPLRAIADQGDEHLWAVA